MKEFILYIYIYIYLIYFLRFSDSSTMGNTQLYLLSLIVALLFITVYAEPLPEGEPEGEPESGAEPEAGANSEPEHNSASLSYVHGLTAIVSFLAYAMLK